MNARFPRMGSRDIMMLLEEHGYEEKRQTGSHRMFYHPLTHKTVPVPVGKKDLPLGTVRAILREAGIKPEMKQ